MIRIVPVLGITLLAVGLAGGGPCATTTTNVVKDCGAETAVGLIDDVNTAVATGGYRDALAELVGRFGACAVRKAVAIVLDKIGVRAKYDSLEAEKEQRLRQWLAEQPVAVLEVDMQKAVINSSKRISDMEIACIVEAVNQQSIECAQEYGVEPQPTVFYSSARELPAAHCRIIDIVDAIDVPGALGYHTNDFGVVYGRVLAQDVHGTGLTLSHEDLEMLIDPSASAWRAMSDGFACAYEVCDPVQGDVYPVNVQLGTVTRTVLLSNYVLPDYFVPSSSGPWDRMRRLTEAFAMSPGGYQIVRDASGKQGNRWARFGGDRARAALGGKFGNPDGRLARRLGVA